MVWRVGPTTSSSGEVSGVPGTVWSRGLLDSQDTEASGDYPESPARAECGMPKLHASNQRQDLKRCESPNAHEPPELCPIGTLCRCGRWWSCAADHADVVGSDARTAHGAWLPSVEYGPRGVALSFHRHPLGSYGRTSSDGRIS